MASWKSAALGALLMGSVFGVGCNVEDGPTTVKNNTTNNNTTDACSGVTCSDHGTCSVVDDAAVCTCTDNFTGDDCSTCADGYTLTDGACVQAETCADNNPCTDNGTCVEGDSGLSCTCDDGFAGDTCDTCDTGYLANADGGCDRIIPCAEADPCGDYGTCSDTDAGVVCACDTGYDGSRCDVCAETHYMATDGTCQEREYCQTDTCNGRGTCSDVTGLIECTCDATFGGDRCDGCYPGYVPLNDTCVVAQQCQAGSCFGKGTCDDSTGFVVCTCEPGYAAPVCNGCALGHTGADCLTCLDGYRNINGVCTPVCADGKFVEGEACDDGNTDPSNGTTDYCSSDCQFTNWPGTEWPGYIPPVQGNVWINFPATNVNNTARYVKVAAGSTMTVNSSFFYNKDTSGCPGCVNQIYLGVFSDDPTNMDALEGKPQFCYSFGGTVTVPINAQMTAPTTPGLYYLRWSRTWLYSCDTSMADYGMGANLAAIWVE